MICNNSQTFKNASLSDFIFWFTNKISSAQNLADSTDQNSKPEFFFMVNGLSFKRLSWGLSQHIKIWRHAYQI